MPAGHNSSIGHASCLWKQEERESRADEGEGAGEAKGRRVALVEGAVDWAGGERDYQLSKSNKVTRVIARQRHEKTA